MWATHPEKTIPGVEGVYHRSLIKESGPPKGKCGCFIKLSFWWPGILSSIPL